MYLIYIYIYFVNIYLFLNSVTVESNYIYAK